METDNGFKGVSMRERSDKDVRRVEFHGMGLYKSQNTCLVLQCFIQETLKYSMCIIYYLNLRIILIYLLILKRPIFIFIDKTIPRPKVIPSHDLLLQPKIKSSPIRPRSKIYQCNSSGLFKKKSSMLHVPSTSKSFMKHSASPSQDLLSKIDVLISPYCKF